MRLKFHTSRPESFAIYKRTREDGPWVPYQYYSGSCENTYLKASRGFIRTGGDEQQALCTDEFSDISPLTGGNVAFSTLEGRPSAYNFDNSPVLQVGAGGGTRWLFQVPAAGRSCSGPGAPLLRWGSEWTLCLTDSCVSCSFCQGG